MMRIACSKGRGSGVGPVVGWMVVAAAVWGCQDVPEGTLGTELRHGDVGVTVSGVELRVLDLQAESGAVVTTQTPLLLLHLMVTNYSGAAMRYDVRDAATVGQQGLTPLLFVDPGSDQEWRTQANNVPLVTTSPYRYLGDPVAGLVTIGAGETIHDVLMFEPPAAGASQLVLSLPPTIFGPGAERPVLIRIPYEAPPPIQPPVASLGEMAAGDGFGLTLTGYEIDYWPNVDRSGFSEQALLGLRYTITNTGTEPLRYGPPHFDPVGTTAPVLSDGTRIFNRAQLRSGRAAGQRVQPVMIQPGESVSDVALFERPDPTVRQLLLLFAGHNVGRTGQVRVRFAYQFADPPMPAELLPPTPEPEHAPEEGAPPGPE